MSVESLSSPEDLVAQCADPTFSDTDLPDSSLLFQRRIVDLSLKGKNTGISHSFSLSHLFKKWTNSSPDPKTHPSLGDLNLDEFSITPSKCYDLERPELERGEIGFINGILTEYREAEQHAFFLSSLAKGRNIHGVYKARRPLHLELLESFSPLDTPPVFLLQNQWRCFFSAHPDLKYLQICHSQGALHVKKALMGLTDEERNKIIVVAIAPQELIPKNLCYKADHYLSSGDFIPFLRTKESEESLANVHIRAPGKKAHLLDHDFESFSYREALRFHIESYMEHPEG